MFIKRNWVEILVFGAILAVLLVCNAPGMTWINTDSDGAHYIYFYVTSVFVVLTCAHVYTRLLPPYYMEAPRLSYLKARL